MKIANKIGIRSSFSIRNKEATVISIFSDAQKRIFRVETEEGKRFQFIVFNDGTVSKLFELNA